MLWKLILPAAQVGHHNAFLLVDLDIELAVKKKMNATVTIKQQLLLLI